LKDHWQQVSGQKVNTAKSGFIVARNASRATINRIKRQTEFTQAKLPIIYLGNTLYSGQKKSAFFDHIITKIKEKITGWSVKLMSIGARLNLIKHVLATIPLYTFQAIPPTMGVLEMITKLLNKFLWSNNAMGRSINWTKWTEVCKPISEGGLGLRKWEDIQNTMEAKLWWHFRTSNTLWAEFVKVKYFQGKHHSQVNRPSRYSPLFNRLKKAAFIAEEFIYWEVGEGNVSAWYDRWTNMDIQWSRGNYGEHTLVKEFITNGRWDITKLTEICGEEQARIIANNQLKSKDKPVWTLTPTGEFKTKATWERIRSKDNHNKALQTQWSPNIPPKHSILGWRIYHRKIPTDLNLKSRGFNITSKCYHGCSDEETDIHLFWNCNLASQVWREILKWLGMDPFHANSGRHLINIWSNSAPTVKKTHIAIILSTITFSNLWQARNDKKDRGINTSPNTILQRIPYEIQMASKANPLSRQQLTGNLHIAKILSLHIKKDRKHAPLAVFWRVPPQNCFKLNTDAAKHRDGRISGGGIVRNSEGKHIASFISKLNAVSVEQGETLAILKGLSVCQNLNLGRVLVETDSLLAFQWIQGSYHPPSCIADAIDNIKAKLVMINGEIQHIFREQNSIADILAKRGEHIQQEWIKLGEEPNYLKPYLVGDLIYPNIRSRLI
jgi:ribonuclease HI